MEQSALNTLADQFLPKVALQLAPCLRVMNSYREKANKPAIRVEADVTLTLENEHVTMCLLMLTLAGPMGKPKPALDFRELEDFMAAMVAFCGYEGDKAKAVIDGKLWVLGDGDDPSAVGFHDGRFFIWLRSFKG